MKRLNPGCMVEVGDRKGTVTYIISDLVCFVKWEDGSESHVYRHEINPPKDKHDYQTAVDAGTGGRP